MAYLRVNAIFTQLDVELSAAEAHGMATALLCVNDAINVDYWLNELPHEAEISNEMDLQVLSRLFDETRRLLQSDSFEFDLFLPDEDAPLADQVIAFKQWCQGFLYGLGSMKANLMENKEIRDIIKDVTEFTKLDSDVEGHEDENAFMEISEYLRSAVLLLRDELKHELEHVIH